MLRWAIHAAVLASILAAVEGCGSSNHGSGGPDASTDGGVIEASAEAEAGPDCGPNPPTGMQLAASADPLVVFTLTTEHAIYEDLTTQELYAAPLTGGGMPSDIGKMTSQAPTLWTNGPAVVYLPTPADPNSAIATLSAWSPTTPSNVISKSVIAWDGYEYTYDVSKDGQYVAYYETTTDRTATLMVSTIDGKTQTPLVPGIDLQDLDARNMTVFCNPPVLQFVNDTLIAQYCVPPTATADAGTPSETLTIAAFAAPNFAMVTLGTMFPPYNQQTGTALAVDPTGKQALLSDSTGKGLYLYPLAGGNPVTVDATGTNGFFLTTGDILYTTQADALMRYTASSGTTTTLVPTHLTIPIDVSPDGNWLQAAYLQSSTTGLSDLYLMSATTAGTATAVVATETTSAMGFTADSNFSVFGTSFSPPSFAAPTYDLEATKPSGGMAVKALTGAVAFPLYTTASKLVTNTNQTKATGAADIVALDLSTSAGPTTLVSQADQHLFQTSTKQVVYSWYCDGSPMAGVWALTPP
jgi:hypothetical protein